MRLSRPFSKRRFQEDGGVIAGSFLDDRRGARSQEMARLGRRTALLTLAAITMIGAVAGAQGFRFL
jgi:hypothetical protein